MSSDIINGLKKMVYIYTRKKWPTQESILETMFTKNDIKKYNLQKEHTTKNDRTNNPVPQDTHNQLSTAEDKEVQISKSKDEQREVSVSK